MNSPQPLIFLDHSGPALTNVGDLAMLMVAFRRLREVFPEARIAVPANSLSRLHRFCPGVRALDETALALLVWRRLVPGPWSRRVPLLERWENRAGARWPLAMFRARSWRNSLRGERPADTRRCLHTLRHASLFVAAGGGYFNDLFPGHTNRVLDVLQVAVARRRPLVLLGQGFGTVADPYRRRAMKRILRSARMIRLREAITGPQVLEDLGAWDERALVTGDDAIEMAHGIRSATPGHALGVNVRITQYAGVHSDGLERLKRALATFAEKKRAPLLSCPIAFDEDGGDGASVRKLLSGVSALEPTTPADDPESVMRQVGRCRVVVTGSYHAGVFALSQGIPVIGLAKSMYYVEKFAGLAGQFGDACVTVKLDDPGFEDSIHQQLSGFWEDAPGLRAQTLAAAEAQIQLSRESYSDLRSLLKPV